MTVIGNIAYIALAVLGGLWFPLNSFPEWLQSIGEFTPTYQLMQVVSAYLEHHEFNILSALVVLGYTVFFSVLVIQLKKRIEVK